MILYTSGTTGQPKGAELTHAQPRAATSRSTIDLFSARRTTTSSSAGCRCSTRSARRAGSTPRRRRRVARAAPALRRRPTAGARRAATGVTVFEGVPTMYAALLDHAERDALRRVRRCASACPAAPRCRSRSCTASRPRFGCVDPRGLRAVGDLAGRVVQPPPAGERKPGSIGTPIDGVEMRLVDTVAGRGRGRRDRDPRPQRDEGLLAPPRGDRRGDRADGWFRTGDMARVDEDGFYFIVDRKKDLIIRGGYNVYPREIEEVLYEHPAVAEAAVIGDPAPGAGRGGRRRRGAQAGRRGDAERAARLREGAGRAVQVPAASSGSSTRCRRARPARSSSGRSSYPWRSRDRRHGRRRARRARDPADRRGDRGPAALRPAGAAAGAAGLARRPRRPARRAPRSAPSSPGSPPGARGTPAGTTAASPTPPGSQLAAAPADAGLPRRRRRGRRPDLRRRARLADRAPGALRRRQRARRARPDATSRWSNPAVLKAIVDQGGANLVRGGAALRRATSRGRRGCPRASTPSSSQVGEQPRGHARARSCCAPRSSS